MLVTCFAHHTHGVAPAVTKGKPLCQTESYLPHRCASSLRWLPSSQARRQHSNPRFRQSPGPFEAPVLTSSSSRASRTPPLQQVTVDGVHPCRPNRGQPFGTLRSSDRNVPSRGILPPAGVAVWQRWRRHLWPRARTVSPSTSGRRRNRQVSDFRSWCGSMVVDSPSVQEHRLDPAPRCWRVVER